MFSNNSMLQGTNTFSNLNQGNTPNNTSNSNFFGSVGNQSTNIFQNSSAPQASTGMFGQPNSMFSQGLNAGNQGGNFLKGFSPTTSLVPPAGINPNLLAPRK